MNLEVTVALLLNWMLTIAVQVWDPLVSLPDNVILNKNKQLFSFFSWLWKILYLYNTLMNQAPTENILWMLQCYLPGQSEHNMVWLQSLVTNYITWCGQLTIHVNAQCTVSLAMARMNFLHENYHRNNIIPWALADGALYHRKSL